MNLKALIESMQLQAKRDGRYEIEVDLVFKVTDKKKTVTVDYKLTKDMDQAHGKVAQAELTKMIVEALEDANGLKLPTKKKK